MGLQDYSYRLLAQGGDSTPHDELAVSDDLSGGTITLVDMGSGDYAWRCVGAATAAAVSRAINAGASGGGVTIAIRWAVTNYGSTDFALLAGYVPSGQTAQGVNVTRTTANVQRYRYDTLATPTQTINTSIRTLVIKAAMTTGNDQVYVWLDETGRSGSTPTTQFASAQTLTSRTCNELRIGSSGTTIEVSDFVVWPEELSDADCAALADDGIRATLDTASITGSANQTLDPLTQSATGTVVSGITGSASQLLDAISQSAAGSVSGLPSISGSASQALAAFVQSAAGTVTTPSIVLGPFANNTGLLSGLLTNHGIAHAVVLRASDRNPTLSLGGLSTDASGYLTIASTSLVVGTAYMVPTWNADGSAAGIKRAVAS